MRIITRRWATFTIMLCGIMMAATAVHAQAPYQEPVGVESSWDISGTSILESKGTSLQITYDAVATFETTGNEYAQGEDEDEFLISTQLAPISFLLVGRAGEDDELRFTLSSDAERTAAAGLVSSVTAHNVDEALPAAAEFQFHARITFDGSEEDDYYISENPVRLVNADIGDWPLDGQDFDLAENVVFVSVLDPNRTVTIKNLNAAVIAQPKITTPCTDVCCQTTALTLNTGYDHGFGSVYPTGSLDQYWTIVSDVTTTRPVPRSANVIKKFQYWPNPQPGTQWIGPNPTADDSILGAVTYQKCFCLCQASTLTISLGILVDDRADIYLDGSYLGSTVTLPGTPQYFTFVRSLGTGRHCLEIVVHNDQIWHSGLNVQGSIQGSGLLKYNCCGPTVVPVDPCHTNRLQLGTNSSWTLLSGPPGSGSYPRCASIVTQRDAAWGAPTPGTNWIGPNSGGYSVSGPANTYVYRKCFCVAQAGNYAITFTTMADDYVNVRLNGAPLFTHAGYTTASRTTRTFIVALGAGCNCLDFQVVDNGYWVTGLDVMVDIQGALLFKENCCSCANCSSGLPPEDNPPGLSMHGSHDGVMETSPAADRMAAEVAAANTARPTLVNIPGEATGQSTVHYVMDQDAQAEVKLYNAEGELVRVVDEGARGMGGHAVSLVTTDLPAGSYRLQLVYGEHTLAVPVDVQ